MHDRLVLPVGLLSSGEHLEVWGDAHLVGRKVATAGDDAHHHAALCAGRRPAPRGAVVRAHLWGYTPPHVGTSNAEAFGRHHGACRQHATAAAGGKLGAEGVHLLPESLNELFRRVLVHYGFGGDLLGGLGPPQGGDGLFIVHVRGRDRRQHGRLGVAPEHVPEEPREATLAEGDVGASACVLATLAPNEGLDALAERGEGLVDVLARALEGVGTSGVGTLGARKVDQGHLALPRKSLGPLSNVHG
mmetsp:Transcript_13678/g.39877  ORF Transcript_13678/g.39877 Transcript_13678/m.39877 type:complete len:246 (+) Transcript_13678:1818-2555(+)